MENNLNTQPEKAAVIGENEIRKAKARLKKYQDSKKQLDERIKRNEQFWKMRHLENKGDGEKHRPTGWLLNAIHSKHADMMDGYPAPSIRAKEENDVGEAKKLSEIIPVILEAAKFKTVYDAVCRDKINKGTGVYAVYWDSKRNFGKGDISVEHINFLNLYYEPEITDIQKSKEVFLLAEDSAEHLKAVYPQLKDVTLTADITQIERYENEESVDRSDKCTVIDWYYKKWQNGREVLHYCKFVGETVLYASENDTQRPQIQVIDPYTNQGAFDENGQPVMQDVDKSIAEKGWYENGKYPFVFDVMFPIENSPCGYGYTDLFKGTQENIDEIKHSILKIAHLYGNPRFFYSKSAGVNIEDLADTDKQFVPVEGSLDGIKQIEVPQVPDILYNILTNEVEELKEVTGNRDVNNGSTSSGVTAASAIAALQEHAGKLSRHSKQKTYESVKDVTYQVIERIRQFYNADRQFRITGIDGAEHFIHYSNSGIKPQELGDDFGNSYGNRMPEFDIIVTAAKATGYSKLSQNEFALQLYNTGVFVPQNADVVLPMLQLMDFDDKDKVIQAVQKNATLMKQLQWFQQLALGLAQKYEPETAQGIMMSIQGQSAPQIQGNVNTEITKTNPDGTIDNGEYAIVEKARERSQASTQPA